MEKWRIKWSQQSKAFLNWKQANYIRFQGLGIIFLGSLLRPLVSRLHLWSHYSFFMKGSTYLMLNIFISLFPAGRILEATGDSLGSLVHFWDNPMPLWFLFRWLKDKDLQLSMGSWFDWGNMWVTPLISSKSLLCNWTLGLIVLWVGWEFSKSSCSGFF